MSIEEELHENAEQARQPFDKRVAATMAVIAAALAIVSVLGHICTTEEIVLQQRAADQWAFSQAKNIRRYESEVAIDLLSHLPETSTETRKYKDNLGRYERETEENQSRAREFEKERDIRHKEALRLHLGQVFLEISIVLASLAILTKRPMLWWLSVICTTVGLIIASSTALINRDATRGSPTRAQHDSNARPTATQTGCNTSVDLVNSTRVPKHRFTKSINSSDRFAIRTERVCRATVLSTRTRSWIFFRHS